MRQCGVPAYPLVPLTQTEAARLAGCTKQAIADAIARGTLPSVPRVIAAVDPLAFQAWMARRRPRGPKPRRQR